MAKSESAFRFESLESSAVANSQALANLTPSGRLVRAKTQVLAYLVASGRLVRAKTQVLAYLIPSGRLVRANSQVLANLVLSDRQLKHCTCATFYRDCRVLFDK